MAEIVSSAVAQEAVNQVLSTIKERYKGKSETKEHMERMEMAHIKLEAALEMSDKWNTTSTSLLHWRSKLKRAAKECDDTLRSCKQRLQENEEMEQGVRSSFFPKRILCRARSLVSSIINHGNEEPSGSTVRRYEWLAEGASEFLRYMELGGTPRQDMFFHPLVRHLLEGKGAKYCLVCGDKHLLFVIRPFNPPGYGLESRLIFQLEDGSAPENNFLLGLHLRLTESTDIVGVIVRCMQLFTPHLRSTAETVKIKLTQLPTQDFCWIPSDYSIYCHWDNLHTIFCKWFRPNPLCCKKNGHRYMQRYAGSSTSSSSESYLCDLYLEQVTQVYLQGHVAASDEYNRRSSVVDGETCPMRGLPFLKISGIFLPHASSDDLSPTVGGSNIEINNREAAQCCVYANISFEQLCRIILSKAVDCLRGNAATTSHQMLWQSKHGGSYNRIEESSWWETSRKGRKRQKWQGKNGNKVHEWTSEVVEFVGSLVVHAPAQLQGSIADWVQKQKRMLHIRSQLSS